jgi:Tol biopolymer transport system component
MGEVGSGTLLLRVDQSGNVLDTVTASGRHWSFAFSPDGRRVATDLEEASQTSSDVWIVDLDRKTRTRITFDEEGDWSPVWSPDGSRVAFQSRRDGIIGIYAKNADGTGTIEMMHTFERPMWPSQWTPDGEGILAIYASGPDGAEVWYVPVDSAIEPYPLLQLPENQYDPRLSPDGRWLAYGSDETGEEHVYVTTFPELRGRWQVSVQEGDRPRWSGDGSRMYYLSNDDEVIQVSVDGSGNALKVGEFEKKFQFEGGARPGRVYAVSRTDQTMMLNIRPTSRTTNSMVLVQNWLAEFE